MIDPGVKVLDSSIILAALLNERSDENLIDLIEGAVLSAVNLSEVLTKAAQFGLTKTPKLRVLLGSLERIEAFTAAQAEVAAAIWSQHPKSGISFGDRSCLALAIELGAEVYTADRAWAGVQVGCTIHLIR